MLKSYVPLKKDHLYLSDSETESDDLSEHFNVQNRRRINRGIYVGRERYQNKRNKKKNIANEEGDANLKPSKKKLDKMKRKTAKYQEYMKQLPAPTTPTESPISFISWQALANSMIQKYEQPLHYLTLKTVQQWDESRIGAEDDSEALDSIIHPMNAENTIWVVENYHRLCSSHDHLAKLWLADPMHHDFVDSIIP